MAINYTMCHNRFMAHSKHPMNDLIQRYENGNPLTRAEIETLATELGPWVIAAWEEEQQAEAEHQALIAPTNTEAFLAAYR